MVTCELKVSVGISGFFWTDLLLVYLLQICTGCQGIGWILWLAVPHTLCPDHILLSSDSARIPPNDEIRLQILSTCPGLRYHQQKSNIRIDKVVWRFFNQKKSILIYMYACGFVTQTQTGLDLPNWSFELTKQTALFDTGWLDIHSLSI